MKKITSVLALFAVLALFSTESKAQTTFGHAGLDIGIPVGDWSDAYPFAVGGSGGIELGLSDKLAITATGGISFFGLDDEVSDFIASAWMLPLQAGARFYLDEQRSGLFIGVHAGVHILGVRSEDFEFGGVTVEGESDTDTYLSVAPEVGFFLNDRLSLSLKYQLIFQPEEEITTEIPGFDPITTTVDAETLGYIGLKIAYNF